MYKVKFQVWRLIILDLQYYTFFTGFGVQSIKYIHEEQYNLTMELKRMLSNNKTHGAGAQTHNGLYCYCTLLQSRNILYCHVFIKQEVLGKNKLFTTAINILEASPNYIPCATRGFNPKFLHYNFRCAEIFLISVSSIYQGMYMMLFNAKFIFLTQSYCTIFMSSNRIHDKIMVIHTYRWHLNYLNDQLYTVLTN